MSINENVDRQGASGAYIIRLLNTQLKDCQYEIDSEGLHIIVAPSEELEQDESLLLSDAHILIPDNKLRAQFKLIIAQSGMLLQQSDGVRYDIPLQTVIHHEHLYFAVKEGADELWSEEVESFHEPEKTHQAKKKTMPEWNHKYLIFIVSLILLISAAGSLWWLQSKDLREQTSLSSIISGKQGHYDIVRGSDSRLYVIAQNFSDYAWADRAIQRYKPDFSVSLILRNAETKRIADKLKSEWPMLKFHRVNIDNISTPEIILSLERNNALDDAFFEKVRTDLKNTMSYAKNIVFKKISDNIVSELAENGLQKKSITYSKIVNHDSVMFRIQGTLQDNELNALKGEVLQFNEQWQGMYVFYYVELENDWLKGKSFQYGVNGYVKMTPGHWYFPSPTRGNL